MNYLPCRACAKKQPPEYHSYYECPMAECENCGGRGHFLSRCTQSRHADSPTTTFTEDEKPRFLDWSYVALSRQCAAVGLKNGEIFEMAQRLEYLWDTMKEEKKEDLMEKKKYLKKKEKKKEKKEEKNKEEEMLLPELLPEDEIVATQSAPTVYVKVEDLELAQRTDWGTPPKKRMRQTFNFQT